ncbi:hypothetical protein C2E21_2305 [Chlorella sorokiniana]|uniref:Uncharacterized protein n=1 Tax=Chlorella sorokiniana TaxID=3076 RepID=A0A2P6TYN6_CHLSO|nr:hypothetical protein C2E21_2305 [Chlorella sorokiniana]PRW59168.1 hypothetical protein C2E21_2305 [Chlorella sorokiniana]|eukprot:PRW59167.1 hypothetical protein C2E21_2305 [Chlorella sorokiniana]
MPSEVAAAYDVHNLSRLVLKKEELVKAVLIEAALQSCGGAGSLLSGLLIRLRRRGVYGLYQIAHLAPSGRLHIRGESFTAAPTDASSQAATEAEFQAFAHRAQQAGPPCSMREMAKLQWQRALVPNWIKNIERAEHASRNPETGAIPFQGYLKAVPSILNELHDAVKLQLRLERVHAAGPGALPRSRSGQQQQGQQFSFKQQLDVLAKARADQQTAEAAAAAQAGGAPTSAAAGTNAPAPWPAVAQAGAPWVAGTTPAGTCPPTAPYPAAAPYAVMPPYAPYGAAYHGPYAAAAAPHLAGYYSTDWHAHGYAAPAAGYAAPPGSYATAAGYAAPPASYAAAPAAAHPQGDDSGDVQYSVAWPYTRAGVPSGGPLPPPAAPPAAASAVSAAPGTAAAPKAQYPQQQQQPSKQAGPAVAGSGEEQQGSAQAAATKALEAAVEDFTASSPRDEHWHWDPVLALERRCLSLLHQQGQQPYYQLLRLLREHGMRRLPPFLGDAGESEEAAFRRFLGNRPHLFEVANGDELRPAPASADLMHIKQLLLDTLYAQRLRRAPISELHALLLERASSSVKLLPLKMAVQAKALDAFSSFLLQYLGDSVWLWNAPGQGKTVPFAELRPFDGSPDAAFLRQCRYQPSMHPDATCSSGAECGHAHALPRLESAPTPQLLHNTGSNADRAQWAAVLQQLCNYRCSSGRGVSPAPEEPRPAAAPGQAAAAADHKQQQAAAAAEGQPSDGSQVTCDAAEQDSMWGLEPVGGSGQTLEISSRPPTSADEGTDDAAATAPSAALPTTLAPAPWAQAAVQAAAAQAPPAARPDVAAAAGSGAVPPAAQLAAAAAAPSRTWQGTLQFEDGEEALPVAGDWSWPDGTPAKSTFVPPGHSLLLSEEHECCDEELASAAVRWAALDAPCCALWPAMQGPHAGEAEATFEAGLDIMAAKSCGYLLVLPGGRQLLVAPLPVVQAALEQQAAEQAGAAQQAPPPVLAQLAQQAAEAEHVLLALSLGTEGTEAADEPAAEDLLDERFWDPVWQMECAMVSKLVAEGPQPLRALQCMELAIPPFLSKYKTEPKEAVLSRFIAQRSHLFTSPRAQDRVELSPGAASFLVLKKRLLAHLARCPQQRTRLRDLQQVARAAPPLADPQLRELASRDIGIFCRQLLSDCIWLFPGVDAYCELRPFDSSGGLSLNQPRQCEVEHVRGECPLGFSCPKCHATPRGQGTVRSLVTARLTAGPAAVGWR